VILEIKGHHMTNDPKSLIDLLLDAGYVEQEPL
jgi:hypothetical protein